MAHFAKFYSREIRAKSPGVNEGKLSEASVLSVRHLEALLQTFCLLCDARRCSKGCPGARAAPPAPHPLLEDGTSISKAKPNLKYTSQQSGSALKPMTFSCLMSIKGSGLMHSGGPGPTLLHVWQVLVWERKVNM